MFRLTALLLAAACSSAPSEPAAPEPAPPDLLGQWQIIAVNGRASVVGRDGRPPEITFDEQSYGAYAGCNGFGGQGLAHEGRFYGGFAMSTATACGPPFDGQETAVQRMLASAPRVEWHGADRVALIAPNQRLELRYGNGPNGEILLVSGGHWMVGDLVRRGSSEAASLAGRYEVEDGPTASQRHGANSAELILTRNAYYLWDGCNRTEGLAITFERQLFLHGSGLTTLATCLPRRDDVRLKRIILTEPRIGRIPSGLLLSSPAGAVRLRRTGDAPPGIGGVTTRLVPGMRLTLLGDQGGTLAIMAGDRFRLTQPCGATDGRWRSAPRETDGAVGVGPDGPAGACERDPAAQALQRAFIGSIDVVIGPNRDIALFAGRFGAVRARLER